MNNSLISIIVPSFNRATLIEKTLESICKQTYQNWECLVVDDFSTDDTLNIVNRFCSLHPKFKSLTNQRKKGAQGARNTGILNATGDYIIFFDSDDIMLPEFVEKLYSNITQKNTDITTCFSTKMDRTANKEIGKFTWICNGNIHSQMLKGETYVDYNCAIIKKSKLFEIGLTDENCPSFQEWDTHLRLSKVSTYSTVEEELAYYYVNGSDTISSDKRREVNGYLYIFKKHKNDWLNCKKAFLQFGFAVIKLLDEIKDTEFKRSKLRELYNTVDGLKSAVILQKIKYKILWLRLLKKKVLG